MFALYQQYGVPKVEGHPAIDFRRTEQAMREAFVGNPDGLRDIFAQEIAFHKTYLSRDHSCRAYVQMLNRILGIEGADAFAEHDEQMRQALANLPDAKPAPSPPILVLDR